LLAATVGHSADLSQRVFWGDATDRDGKLVYREKHTQTYAGETLKTTVTEYLSDGRLIATLTADYGRSISLPTYQFTDHRNGYREGLRHDGSSYQVFSQEPGDDERTRTITASPTVFSCQGWHYYLVNNLDLLAREDIGLSLVLPGLLDAYRFEVSQTRSTGRIVEARLTLRNWLFRLFTPKVRLVYDRNLAKLVEYEGVSNITDAKGSRQDVRIVYRY
jgi:hypothetical protein